jgi:hypothetical protein
VFILLLSFTLLIINEIVITSRELNPKFAAKEKNRDHEGQEHEGKQDE